MPRFKCYDCCKTSKEISAALFGTCVQSSLIEQLENLLKGTIPYNVVKYLYFLVAYRSQSLLQDDVKVMYNILENDWWMNDSNVFLTFFVACFWVSSSWHYCYWSNYKTENHNNKMDPSFQYLLNQIWMPSSVYLHLVQDIDVMKPQSTLFRIEDGARFFWEPTSCTWALLYLCSTMINGTMLTFITKNVIKHW